MRAFLASLTLCLASCQHDPYTWNYTTSEPKVADLVGTYAPDARTKKLIAEEGRYETRSTSITLSADGALTLVDIPDWWLTSFGRPAGGFDSGRGTWRVGKHQRWWAVSVLFESTESFASQPDHRGLGSSLMLVGERPPYTIHLPVGDPDEARAMQFERVSTQLK